MTIRGEQFSNPEPFLFLIRLFREVAADELDELDDDDEDEDGSDHDVSLETLVAVADGEIA